MKITQLKGVSKEVPFFYTMKNQKTYGLLGKTLGHSFSRKYFSQKFNNENVNALYENYELAKIEEFKKILNENEFSGLNVTIPYKEVIIPYLDDLSAVAKRIGAVNTIQFVGDKLVGHNTDVFGFKQMIKPFFKSRHERAIILGTGGASKAVAYVLEELGCDIIYVSRKPTKEGEFSYDDMNENMLTFCKIVVNCTPVGTYPNVDDFPQIPYEFIGEEHLMIDLIYNPEKTEFLRKSEEKGAWILNGKTMLEQQAEKAWEIWGYND